MLCVFLLVLLVEIQGPAGSCPDAGECRRLALEASARRDFEVFHDLAWRAVQKGKPNDPALMLLLARAQSLSGRPGDALVMLSRLADLGAVPDVQTDPDFARVRALGGWPELEARLTGTKAPPPSAPAPPAPAMSPASPAPSGPAASAPSAPSAGFDFASPGLEPFAVTHDAVSRRFVVGDRRANRLVVLDEVSHNVVSFVGAASAGFLAEITGLAIDARRGDLWVVSSEGEGDAAVSALHKLQLVSGRRLLEVRAPARSDGVRFVAVAVAADGTAYALDAHSPRLFRLRPGARAMELVMRLDREAPGAMAVADERTLFVAHGSGLARIDLSSKTSAPVKSAEDLSGFESLVWRGGALLGVERVAASYLVVRVALDASGTRAQPRQILAASPTPIVGTVADRSFYYLSDGSLRRVALR